MEKQTLADMLLDGITKNAYFLLERKNPDDSYPYREIKSSVDSTVGLLGVLRYCSHNLSLKDYHVPIYQAFYGAQKFLTEKFKSEGKKNYWTEQENDPKTVADLAHALRSSAILNEAMSILENSLAGEKPVQEKTYRMQNRLHADLSILSLRPMVIGKDELFDAVLRDLLTYQQDDGSFFAYTEPEGFVFKMHMKLGGYRRELTSSSLRTLMDDLGYPAYWEYDGRKVIQDAGNFLFHPPFQRRLRDFFISNLVYRVVGYRSTLLGDLSAYLSLNPEVTEKSLSKTPLILLQTSIDKPPEDFLNNLRETLHLISIREKLIKASQSSQHLRQSA